MEEKMTKKKIIIDTDIGDDIDDLLALAFALKHEAIDILGIATVFKNVQARAKMAKYVNIIARQPGIPVAAGFGKPIVDGPIDTLFDYVDCQEEPGQYQSHFDSISINQEEDIVSFYNRLLSQSKEPVTLLVIGPLTNIAKLIKNQIQGLNKVEKIVLMGGAYDLNMAEYNVLCDPEAAKIVFESGIPIQAVGLDVTLKCQLGQEEIDLLRQSQDPLIKLLVTSIDIFVGYSGHLPYLHDVLAIADFIEPSLTYKEAIQVGIETQGELTRGMTFNISKSRWWEKDKKKNIVYSKSVDSDKVIHFFMDTLLK